ncbi:hypothetical protein AV530_016967 [Patagioenas fasciata monilis]|uniref:Uncharacterized protein n=1 Tax=Patagioenas fasciata monilis TaxID=372326 RepID=A0A1V4J488_PATFA|nr:hypothetical protein AV530_016967 [Patagioenas fasciata monilis]
MEWRLLGDTVWDKTIRGEEEKEIKALRDLWRTVLETLKAMTVKQSVAMTAAKVPAPEQTCPDQSCRPKEKKGLWATLWGLPAVRSGRGVLDQPMLLQSDLRRELETLPSTKGEAEASPSESLE